MDKASYQANIKKWTTWKLILITYGLFIIVLLILSFSLSANDQWGGYIFPCVSGCLGIILLIFGSIIGSFLGESGRRLKDFLDNKVYRKNEEQMIIGSTGFRGSFYSDNFNIWAVRIVGVLLIISVILMIF
jgi:hypothetical protein